MKVIVPTKIDDTTFVDCTVQENEYQAWSGAQTYALGDQVVRPTTHKVYQALQQNIGSKDVRGVSNAATVLHLATDGEGGFVALISETFQNRNLYALPGQVVDGNIVLGEEFLIASQPVITAYVSWNSKNSCWVVLCNVVGLSGAYYSVLSGLMPLASVVLMQAISVSSTPISDIIYDLIYSPVYNRHIMTGNAGVRTGYITPSGSMIWNAATAPSTPTMYPDTLCQTKTGEVFGSGSQTTSPYNFYAAAMSMSASADSPTWGSPVLLSGGSGGNLHCACDSFFPAANTRVTVVSSDGDVWPCTISGTTVTVGTRENVGHVMYSLSLSYDTTERTTLAMYQNADGDQGYGKCITLSDAGVLSYGDSKPFTLAPLSDPYVVQVVGGQALYLYQDESDAVWTGYNIGGPARLGIASVSSSGTVDFGGDVSGVPELMTTETNGYTLWLEVGATNRWKQFDGKISSVTTHTCDGSRVYATAWDESLDTYVATDQQEATGLRTRLAPGPVDSLALINVSGIIANAVVYDPLGNIRAGYTSIIDGIESWAVTDLSKPDAITTTAWDESLDTYATSDAATPIYGTIGESDEIEISLFGYDQTDIYIGETVVGTLRDIGGTQYGLSAGITDYSIYKTDEWGDLTISKRGYAKRIDVPLLVSVGDVSAVYRYLSSMRATPLVWIPSDDTDYNGMIAYGKYKDFSITVQYPTYAACTITIDGLI